MPLCSRPALLVCSLWSGALLSMLHYVPTTTPASQWERSGPTNCSDLVLVAGVSKTGVTSLTAALRQLGHNTFCLPESMRFHFDFWHHLFSGKLKNPDFCGLYTKEGREAIQGASGHALTSSGQAAPVTAVSGGPVYYFVEEIMRDFPAAKVILTERDMDKWYRSFEKFFYRVWAPYRSQFHVVLSYVNRMFRISELARRLGLAPDNGFWDLDRFAEHLFHPQINEVIFDHPVPNEFFWKRAHSRHLQHVREVVPARQLLVFDVTQHSWRELCDFLELTECPNSTFPRLREGGPDYERKEMDFMWQQAFWWQFPLTVIVLLVAIALTIIVMACSLKVKAE